MEKIEKKAIDLEAIKNANEDDLFYFVDNNTLMSERITAPKYSYWKSVFRVFFKKKINWIIIFLLAIVLLMTFVFPAVVPYSEFARVTDLAGQRLNPNQALEHFGSWEYMFGSGFNSEPIFTAIWHSARISLLLATICALINMSIGIVVGALWGYSKKLDLILNTIYNIIANIPYILLITVLVYIIGTGFGSFIFALTVTGWIGIAFFFRTQVMIIRDREYNLASRCLGTRTIKVVTRNILPFLVSVIVTILATELPAYISMEVFLTYIGTGLDATLPSLGHMISAGQGAFMTYPWIFWPPVAISAFITIVLYILGQNLADASDPRTHMQ